MCEVHLHGEHDSELYVPRIAGTTFAVFDMTCSHCVGAVRAAIEQSLPGSDIEINLGAHRVTVTGDAVAAASAIRAAGYTPERVGV